MTTATTIPANPSSFGTTTAAPEIPPVTEIPAPAATAGADDDPYDFEHALSGPIPAEAAATVTVATTPAAPTTAAAAPPAATPSDVELAAHVIRHTGLARLAVEKIDRRALFGPRDPLRLALDAAEHALAAHGSLLSPADLCRAIRDRAYDDPQHAHTPEWIPYVAAFLSAVGEVDAADYRRGSDLLTRFLEAQTRTRIAMRINDATQGRPFDAAAIREDLDATTVGHCELASIANLDVLDEPRPQRRPTGEPLLDMMLGGLEDSATTLLLGPTGGGKSFLAVLAALGTASRLAANERVVYCTTEMNTAEVLERVYLAAARGKYRRADVLHKRLSEYRPEVRAVVDDIQHSPMAERLQVLDCSLTPGNAVAEAAAGVERLAAEGKRCRLLILDWLGPWGKARAKEGDSHKLNLLLGEGMRQLVRLAKEHKTAVVVTHQLCTTEGKQSPVHNHDAYSAEWCRSLGNECADILIVGTRDQVTDLQRLGLPKSRTANVGAMKWFRCDGQTHQIHLAPCNDYAYTCGTRAGLKPVEDDGEAPTLMYPARPPRKLVTATAILAGLTGTGGAL